MGSSMSSAQSCGGSCLNNPSAGECVDDQMCDMFCFFWYVSLLLYAFPFSLSLSVHACIMNSTCRSILGSKLPINTKGNHRGVRPPFMNDVGSHLHRAERLEIDLHTLCI